MPVSDLLRSKVVDWATKAPENRERLKAEPTAVVEEVLKIDVPAGTTIQVLEETANQYYLVLPPVAEPGGTASTTESYKY